jgi:DNA transformation protein
MFGGRALYSEGIAFALVISDEIFIKADRESEGALRAAGSAPFVYSARGKPVTLSYWRLPEDAIDDPEALARWARRGCEAAWRARASPARRSRAAKRSVKG